MHTLDHFQLKEKWSDKMKDLRSEKEREEDRERQTVHGRAGGRAKHLHLPFNQHVSGSLMALKWQPHWHAHHTFIQLQLAMQIRRVSRERERKRLGGRGVIYMLKCSQLSTCKISHCTEIWNLWRQRHSRDGGAERQLSPFLRRPNEHNYVRAVAAY